MECSDEHYTQKKFNRFFEKLIEPRWNIHDSSTCNYLKEPEAKIDISILDGVSPVWLHLVSPLELKNDLRKDHTTALGQIVDRFHYILEHQQNRQYVLGAIASDSHLELVHMDRNRKFYIPGMMELQLNDPESYGLDMLIRFINSPVECNGYVPPDEFRRRIVNSGIDFEFHTLLAMRSGSQSGFVAACTVDSKGAVLKVSRTD